METTFTILSDGTIGNPKAVRKFFDSHEPGTWVLSSKAKNVRSLQANKYFHGPVLDYVFQGLVDAGFDDVKSKEDAKKVVKVLFLKREFVNKQTGEVITYIEETHKLTKDEFNTFIQDIQKWAAEFLSVVIPDPGAQTTIDYQPLPEYP